MKTRTINAGSMSPSAAMLDGALDGIGYNGIFVVVATPYASIFKALMKDAHYPVPIVVDYTFPLGLVEIRDIYGNVLVSIENVPYPTFSKGPNFSKGDAQCL